MSSAAEMITEEKAVPATAIDPATAELPVTVIERRPGWHLVDLGELWRYRDLLYILTWRDIKVRYKQTVLGAAWAVLQPFATMVVFTLFVGRVVAAPSGGIPYSLFVFAGLLPWFFFSNAISSASQSIVGSQSLVTKVYFPRLLIPMSAVGAALVDFVVAFGMLLALMAGYKVGPGWGLVLVPVVILNLLVAAVGVGTLLAALTVAYRDFRYVVPFAVQLWMFATPAVYSDVDRGMGPVLRALLPVNPAQGLITTFRSAMFGQEIELYPLAVSSAVSVALLLIGFLYFRRVEQSFADII